MRFLFLALFAATLSIGLGGWSAAVMLARFEGAGAVDVGPWQANRLAGSPQADPYSKARLARDGNLTLGLAEGIAFRARADSAGLELRRECTYRVAGGLPPARVWTLSAFTPDGATIVPAEGRPPWLVSSDLMRDDANGAEILVSGLAQPGNWLALEGGGPFVLALTIYDTPASTSGGASELAMPGIERLGCSVDG
ncbi:DUF1214 domain-containing protein [Aureimonas populi]|uniref:DUF1214 domain-containing protein n=1 Tax=Aureimonas populi TaxID=1701758 RepID=A0ABW5CJT1_9HYPH|nr:DUF1214 domain-containing protein [Aureimonas populi]